jgi:hypothetical protein
MDAADPTLRGLAAWAAGPLAGRDLFQGLAKLIRDHGRLTVYRDGRLVQSSVGQLAREALRAAEQRQN